MKLRERVHAALGALAPEFFTPAPVGPGRRPYGEIHEVDIPTTRRGPVRPRKKDRKRPRVTPLPVNITRWIQADVEDALLQASSGDLSKAAQLYRAFGRDGTIKGLHGTRYGGLLSLPRTFTGHAEVAQKLAGVDGKKGLFDEYFPRAELQKLATDGDTLGVGIAEFVQGEDDPHPVLVRLDPEFLVYRLAEDTWYCRTLRGLEPVIPGDGHYVLHTPLGRYEPWNHGDWQALARAYVTKEHSILFRENWITKFATPARVAMSPQGAAEEQKRGWFERIAAWGANSVFSAAPGYEVKLLEVTGGQGIKAFSDAIEQAEMTFMLLICGQVVTVTGGSGFANANIHQTVRSNLIQQSGNALADTLNMQALPFVAWDLSGGRTTDIAVAWDTRPPQDLKAMAESMMAAGETIEKLTGKKVQQALAEVARGVDVIGIMNTLAVPMNTVPALGPALAEPLEQLTGEDIAALAAKMTEHQITRCEHGFTNRCRLCGIERERDFEPGEDGTPAWRIVWRPIGRTAAPTPPPPQLPPSDGGQVAARRVRTWSGKVRTVGPVRVNVEFPTGSTRSGTGPDGPWSVEMMADYGYLPGTRAPDGEAVDAYVGPDDGAPLAFVVRQVKKDGAPDEPKVMLGFGTEKDARLAYLYHAPEWAFGSIEPIPVDDLMNVLEGGRGE